MKIIENDPTQDMAQPGVIVSAIRAGGTFLSHCLSNHPHVYCDRGEPLHHRSAWCSLFEGDRRALLRVLLNQTGYRVSMCKLTYVQAFHRDIWPELQELQPRVIWLRRENVIRQAVSVAINQRARAGQLDRPQHTFEAQTVPVAIEIGAGEFLRYVDGLVRRNVAAQGKLRLMSNVLVLSYEEITANPTHLYMAQGLNPDAADRICEFLGVPFALMPADLARVNPWPLSELLTNWHEIRQAIGESQYAALAEKELHWTS
ncbi:MAG: hypothetical protein JXC32_12445 [Anaerolineae bacterium]|nr:hypothetical protein [Anaerolineae bacterium]